MKEYYRPTENLTLKNFNFRAITQNQVETFPAFCNRVNKETKHCNFKCAVDLFGSMPSSKHVVAVQDLASRFPAAKLITSTISNQVIPAFSDIYSTCRNPNNQLSDNGLPFSSSAMKDFAQKKVSIFKILHFFILERIQWRHS